MTTPTGRVLRLTLPPVRHALAPNGSRGDRRARWQAAAAYREVCGWTAALKRPECWQAPDWARITYRLVYCGIPYRDLRCRKGHVWNCVCEYRPADWDNAGGSLKALQDSLVDAQIIVADDADHLTLGGVEIVRHPTGCTCGKGGVEVEIREIGGA